jgi:hypothetical protein
MKIQKTLFGETHTDVEIKQIDVTIA